MTAGYQSLDFVETTGTASIPAQRLRQRRVVEQAEMQAAWRTKREYEMPTTLPYLVVVTTKTEPPPGVRETAARLERLSALPPDWDGSGALAPSKRSLLRAGSLLSALHASTARTLINWRSPHVSASETGEVMLEWWYQARKLTLYMGDSRAQYIKVWGPRIEEDMEDGEFDVDTFDRFWAWLHDQ